MTSRWKDWLLSSVSHILREGIDFTAAAERLTGTRAAQQSSVDLLSAELARARQDLEAGRPEDVLVALRQSLDNLGLVTAATWAVLGQAYDRIERHNERDEAYGRAIDAFDGTSAIPGPDEVTAIVPALVALRRRPEAIDLLERAAREDPDHLEILRLMAAQHEEGGDRTAAAAAYARLAALSPANERVDMARRAAELDSTDVRYRVILGKALLDSGEPDAAIDVLRPSAVGLPSDSGAQTALAEALRQTGSADAAVALIEPVLESKPDDADALLVRARIRRSRGERELAFADLAHLLEAHPDLTAARTERVDLALAAGRPLEALDDLSLLARQLPNDAGIAVGFARVLAQIGDPQRSVTEFDRALKIDPTMAIAHSERALQLMLLGRTEDAMRGFERAIQLDPDAVQTKINYVDALREADKLDKAVEIMNGLIQEQPHNPEVIGTRGQLYAARNDQEKAIQDYRAALVLNPDLPWVVAELTTTLILLEQYADALTAADRLIDLVPDRPEAHILRSRILRSLGQIGDALDEMELVLVLAPTSAMAHYLRGLLLIQLGRYADALADFDAIPPDDTEVGASLLSTWRGETLRLLDRFQDAGECYNRALELEAANAVALMGRGRVRYEEQEFEAAARDFQEAAHVAASTEPEMRISALTWLGETRRRMGQLAEALDPLGQALELDPHFADALAAKGQVHATLGQRAEAIRDFQDAVAQNPDLVWTQVDLAEQLRLEERNEESLNALNEAQRGGVNTAFLHGTRGQVLFALKRVDEAIVELRQAWAMEPAAWIADELARLLSTSGKEADWDDALNVLDAAIEASPEARPLLRRKADVLRTAGRSTDGLAVIDAYLADEPDDQVALATRAHLLIDTGASNEALALATELVRRDPADLLAHFAEVRALTGLDRHSDALALLDELIEKNPSEGWLTLMRANVLCDLRFLTEALRTLGPLLEADPEEPFANAMVGYCERRLEPPELTTAIEHYRRALIGEPDNISYQTELADALRTTGDDEATTLYRSVLETANAIKSPTTMSMVFGAWAAIRLGRPDEAVSSLQDAIQIDSFALSYRFGLGLAQLHGGRGELAVDEYEGASSLAMTRPDPFRAAAVLTEALNDLREDRAVFPESVREDFQEAELAVVDALTHLRAAQAPRSPAPPAKASAPIAATGMSGAGMSTDNQIAIATPTEGLDHDVRPQTDTS
jgi:tetratricopeptide (TPR) repeat protein